MYVCMYGCMYAHEINTHQQTPWHVFRKAFLTDELVAFAVAEFNHYPRCLAASRTRPFYIPDNQVWPPKWVNQSDYQGPMHLTNKEFLKYIDILYILGVKGLGDATISDLFSNDPVLREEWLCKITSRNDLSRFIRQVCECVCV